MKFFELIIAISLRGSWRYGVFLSSWLSFTTTVMADELLVYYIDDSGQAQILTINSSSSGADNGLAATLILDGSEIKVILDEQEDLEIIATAVSEKAPDNLTAIAVRNTILGVGTSLGGRSVEHTSEAPETDIPQVDTPPLIPPIHEPGPPPPPPPPSSSLPPPSSSVVSPN